MNKADPLIAAFRLLATPKTNARAGLPAATAGKENKDKAEHFREQLRVVAQGTKPAEKPETDVAKADIVKADLMMADLAQGVELPELNGEAKEESRTRVKDRSKSGETSLQQGVADTAALPVDWRGPDAALSAVISRLDQAHTRGRGDDVKTRAAHPQIHGASPDMSLEPDAAMAGPKTDDAPEQRFVLSVGTAETTTTPAVKVVVREQETHFEPVQQPTLLQKIVDRMVTDLPAASASTGMAATDVASPDIHRVSDKPLRILTLEMDPPNLGAVTVKMRMIGNAVEIHLSADRPETAQMLRQERGALTEVMQSAGYAFDIASIDQSRASDPNSGNGQPQSQPDQRPSQQSQGGSQMDNAASQRQSSDTQGGARQNRQQHDQVAEQVERRQEQKPVLNRNGGGSLFL
jgi:chemotaxis protein MotD